MTSLRRGWFLLQGDAFLLEDTTLRGGPGGGGILISRRGSSSSGVGGHTSMEEELGADRYRSSLWIWHVFAHVSQKSSHLLQMMLTPSLRSKCTPPPAKYDPLLPDMLDPFLEIKMPPSSTKKYPPSEKYPLQSKPPPSSMKSPSSKIVTIHAFLTLSTPPPPHMKQTVLIILGLM